jgi:predicted RNase H-like HicB family nuclease
MTDLASLTVTIGCIEEGRWLAATTSSPYFCLEAETEEKVVALAGAAIRFYETALNKHGGSLPEKPTFREQNLHVKRRVTARELATAA